MKEQMEQRLKQLKSEFESGQQMLAEMVVETEAARLLAYKACHLLDKGEMCFKECSGIKFFGSETAVRVCSRAMETISLALDILISNSSSINFSSYFGQSSKCTLSFSPPSF